MKIIYYFDDTRASKELPIVQSIYGNEVLYVDKNPWSMLDKFEKGDILICNSVDVLADITDIVEDIDFITKEYMDIYNRGIEIMFDKSTQCNSLFVKTLVSSEQSFEAVLRKCILNYANQKNIEIKYSKRHVITAQKNGNKVGIKKGTKLVTKKSIEMKKQIRKYSKDFDGTMSDDQVIREIGISRNSYYKYKKELRDEGGIKDGIFGS